MFIVWRRLDDDYVDVSKSHSVDRWASVVGRGDDFEVLATFADDDWTGARELVAAKRAEIPQPAWTQP